jgi:hypothetical protein
MSIISERINRLFEWWHFLRNYSQIADIFANDYQHSKMFKRKYNNKYMVLPWYTYPTIEYLGRLDFRDLSVFEYGVGNSTSYWLERGVKNLVGVESDKDWYKKVKKRIKSNNQITLCTDKSKYPLVIYSTKLKYDLIIIDGILRDKCAKHAIKRLNDGGMILLDNSDWYPKSAKILRESKFTQIDFSGFGPGVNFCWTTSIFLRSDIVFEYTDNRRKQIPTGGQFVTANPE